MKNIKIAQDMLEKHNKKILKKFPSVCCLVCEGKIAEKWQRVTIILKKKIYKGFVHPLCKMLLPEEDDRITWM